MVYFSCKTELNSWLEKSKILLLCVHCQSCTRSYKSLAVTSDALAIHKNEISRDTLKNIFVKAEILINEFGAITNESRRDSFLTICW